MNIAKGTIFVLLPGLGMVGNLSVFVNYMWICFMDAEKKPVHIILIHLTFTNIIIILNKAMPPMMVAFGVKNFLHDTGCKIVIFLGRVARGLSMCTYSLLTVVQAITIRPRASACGWHQPKAARHILPCLLFFWVLNSLISMDLLHVLTSSSRNGSHVIENHYYCHVQSQSQVTRWLTLSGMVLHDALFLGLMGMSSGYMVFLLHKHQKCSLYLQNTKRVSTTPPEIKAAHSVLFLMLCFLFFYWTDSMITLCVDYSLKNNFILLNAQLGKDLLSHSSVVMDFVSSEQPENYVLRYS
ncbi:putative vomeronasal receptor-like protein 4 [Tupaia chinensis]|uniref:putative vomeronasal receptor-like protein 4 n=1 Tax=Tupaia chinensis TaxID=246437 RepID=UPI0003C91C39|nr:putative vomeronasal receptor-like protein 4 [Tupaia chinensis]